MAYRPELSSMDKDTILFVFKNRMGFAYHWDFYNKNKSLITKSFVNDIPIKVLYKAGNVPGKSSWVDFDKAVANGQYNGANAKYTFDDQTKKSTIWRSYEQVCCDKVFANGNYLVSQMNNFHIPCSQYIDAQGYRYSIGLNDGVEKYVLRERLNASGSPNKPITIEQGSLINKNISFENRHLMDDIKLTFNNSTPENTMISFNSQLIPVVQDNTDSSVAWIRNGLRMSTHMGNVFTTKFENKIGNPASINYEATEYPTSSEHDIDLVSGQPRSLHRFFFDNTKSYMYGFNLGTAELYRSPNIKTPNSWTKCNFPVLCEIVEVIDNNPTVMSHVLSKPVVFPFKDPSGVTNTLFAMDLAILNNNDLTENQTYRRYIAYSIDNGNTWLRTSYESLFGGSDVRALPLIFPYTTGLYFITDQNNYRDLYRMRYINSLVHLNTDEIITGQIKATINADYRDKIFTQFSPVSKDIVNLKLLDSGSFESIKTIEHGKLSTTRLEDYIYMTCFSGDMELYQPEFYIYDGFAYVYIDTKGFIPIVNSDGSKMSALNIANTSNNGKAFVDMRIHSSYTVNNELKYRINLVTVINISSNGNEILTSLKRLTYRTVITTLIDNTLVFESEEENHSIDYDQTIAGNVNIPNLSNGLFAYVDSAYVGLPQLTNSYDQTDVEQGSNVLYTNKLIGGMRLGTDLETFNISTGDSKLKYVFESKTVDLMSSYGMLFNQVLFDGKKNVIFIGDNRETYTSDLTPVFYNYRLESNHKFHYAFRVKGYRWNGVKCTQQIKARYIEDPKSGEEVASSSIAPVVIGFPVPINPNAFLLMYNGIPITDGSVYVNPHNNHELICENLRRISVMQNYINPIQFIKNTREFIYTDFAIVNFTADDPSKEVYMYLDRASSNYYGKTCEAKFHSDIAGDLVLFNGIDHEYIINRKTKRSITYTMSRFGLSEAVYSNSPYNHIGYYNVRKDVHRDIVRIQFCLKDK